MSLPVEDKSFNTKKDMLNQIKHLLGGRVAEALTLDDISTGASNDIERATDIARKMVTKYGFSEKLGPVNYSSSDGVFIGRDYSKTKEYSEGVATEIDHEIREIIENAYKETEKILKDNMDKLEVVAQALLRVETLDGEQFEALYTGQVNDEELEAQIREKEEKIKEQNEAEARETAKIRREEKRKEEEELARYDANYLSDFEAEVNRALAASQMKLRIDEDVPKETDKPEDTTEAGGSESNDDSNTPENGTEE